MALLWADGFGHWGNENNAQNFGGYYTSQGYFNLIHNDNPRTGEYAARCGADGARLARIVKNVGGDRSTLGFGIAIYLENTGGQCAYGIGFNDGSADNEQISARFNYDGSIDVYQGGNNTGYGPLLGSAPVGSFAYGSYSYVELRCFCDDVNGSVELRVNNVTRFLVTGVDTKRQGNNHLNAVWFGKNNDGVYDKNNNANRFADFVIWDTTGAFNNDFFGDVRCRTMLPTTDGATQDWTPNNAPAYGELNRVPFDPATHFIGTPDVNDVSNFGLTQLPTNTAYSNGIMMFVAGSKTDAGSCEITPQIKSGATVADGTPFNPGTAASYYVSVFDVDPATGNPWTLPALQALAAQVKRTV